MKFDKPVRVMTTRSVSDGMGGWLPSEPVQLATIYTFTTPVKAEIMLKEYGIISTTSLKVFTKSVIPTKDEFGKPITVYFEFQDGSNYKIIQLADFGKIRMALVELIV